MKASRPSRSRNPFAGEKPFNCPSDGCEKTFSSQYSLKSHIRGHDKGAPFAVTLARPLSEASHAAASLRSRFPGTAACRGFAPLILSLVLFSGRRMPTIRCASVT